MNILYTLNGKISDNNAGGLRKILSEMNVKTGVWMYGKSDELDKLNRETLEYSGYYDIVSVQNVTNEVDRFIILGALAGLSWNRVMSEEIK